jgi:hypothetical protein
LPPLDTLILAADISFVNTDQEILAAVDALPLRSKARLMPKLRRRLEDYYDLQAVKRAQKSGVYHPYERVRHELPRRRAAAH